MLTTKGHQGPRRRRVANRWSGTCQRYGRNAARLTKDSAGRGGRHSATCRRIDSLGAETAVRASFTIPAIAERTLGTWSAFAPPGAIAGKSKPQALRALNLVGFAECFAALWAHVVPSRNYSGQCKPQFHCFVEVAVCGSQQTLALHEAKSRLMVQFAKCRGARRCTSDVASLVGLMGRMHVVNIT